jgi:hypothetical protein
VKRASTIFNNFERHGAIHAARILRWPPIRMLQLRLLFRRHRESCKRSPQTYFDEYYKDIVRPSLVAPDSFQHTQMDFED